MSGPTAWRAHPVACQPTPSERNRIFAPRARSLALIALLLTGCATYTPAPLDPAQSARAFATRRLDAPELRVEIERMVGQRAATWPPAAWDRAQLLAAAIAQNPEIAVTRASIEAALAHETGAAERPNPGIGLQSEYASREAHRWLYGVGFDLQLRQPGMRALDIALAQQETRAVRDALMERTWTVRHALTDALSDAENARRRLDLLMRLSNAQDGVIDLQQQRVAAGEDQPGDLVRARTARIETEQQQAQARSDAIAAHAAIASALGVPPAALDGVAIEWSDWGAPPALDEAALASAREAALLSRADLAAAIGEYAQSETKLKQAIARQYPSFDLKPGYYWDHGVAKWPFDVDFSLPIFNRNEGEIAEAKANREVAGKKLLAVQAAIYGEIETALRAERVARENLQAAERRAEAAHTQREHAELALKLGASDRMERTGADALAMRAELEVLQARAGLQTARDALENALHAPLSGPELALALPSPPADAGDNR